MLKKILRRARRAAAIFVQQSGKVFSQNAEPPTAVLPNTGKAVTLDQVVNKIVITGGTRGVGKALAEHFSGLGKKVAIIGTDGKQASEIAASISADVCGYGLDITNASNVDQCFAKIAEDLGGIDLLVNNAGITGKLTDNNETLIGADLSTALDVNVTGALNCTNAAAAIMKSQGRGRIINISTGAVSHALPGATAYGVSKSALEGLTRQHAAELAPFNIAVSTVRLGSIKTDMTKEVFGWAQSETLPEPKEIVPAIAHVAFAPMEMVQGRTFASWRLLGDADVELRSPTALSAIPSFRYPDYEYNGRKVLRGEDAFAIYDRAENYFGCSPEVEKSVIASLKERPSYVYPDETHSDLVNALSEHHGLNPEQFVIGNGSWEVLDRILEMFTQTGDEVISNKPGWFGFHMLCNRRELQNKKIAMKRDRKTGALTHNLDQIAANVTSKTKLVYIISPSNPEGVSISTAEMTAFLEKIPRNLPVIFDEAYFECCDTDTNVSAKSILEKEDRPIIGLRTFSKFHALASYRVGYAYGRASEMEVLRRGERVFNVPHISHVAAIAALKDTDHQAELKALMIEQRQKISDALKRLQLDFIPSQAPYILVELPCDLEKLVDEYKTHGIFIGAKAFLKGKYFLFPVTPNDKTSQNLEILAGIVGK